MSSRRANRALAELADDGAGRLTLRGSRYLLLRPETLATLQRAAEDLLGPRAAECLAAGGRAGGARATGALAGEPREQVESLCRMGSEIGWGEFSLEALGPLQLVITVARSPFAEAYGSSPAGVCHLTRGVLEALAARVLVRPLPVVETACAAAGAALCRFEARP